MSSKESAEEIARIAQAENYQTISFDLPRHGERKDEENRCNIWNGVHHLTVVADYVFSIWRKVNPSAFMRLQWMRLHRCCCRK